MLQGEPGPSTPIELSPRRRRRAAAGQCNPVPGQPNSTGDWYLRLPTPHAFAKLQGLLEQRAFVARPAGRTLIVEVPGERAPEFTSLLETTLSSIELDGIRGLVVPSGRDPSETDYFQVDTLARLISRVHGASLGDILRSERLTSVFQPIVHVDAPNRVFAYEALLRVRNGDTLELPADIFRIARSADLLPALDLAARKSAICEAARHRIASKLFINFAPTAISDPKAGLETTVATIDAFDIPHDQIVFEVIETDLVHDIPALSRILDHYRDAGFCTALDDLGAGYASLTMLGALKPDYVKLDRELTRGVDHDPYKALIARKLIETAKELEIKVVAEGIETQGEFEWIRRHGSDFVQGFHIAYPETPPRVPTISSKKPRAAQT